MTRILQHKAQMCLSIQGAKGSGKTASARALTVAVNPLRRLFFDPMCDYSAYAQCNASTWDEVEEYTHDIESDWQFSIAYTPMDMPEPLAVAKLASLAMRLEDCTLIVDEAHDSCSHKTVHPDTIKCAKRGRHKNVGFWAISQRPSDIAVALRSELNSNLSFYLRLVEEIDLDILRGRRGKQFAAEVSRLPPLYGFALNPLRESPIPFGVDPRGAGRLFFAKKQRGIEAET